VAQTSCAYESKGSGKAGETGNEVVMATGISITAQAASNLKEGVCEPCMNGKRARKPFPSTSEANSVPEVVHSDLSFYCRAHGSAFAGWSAHCFATCLDDFYDHFVVRTLRAKYKFAHTAKTVIKFLATQTGNSFKNSKVTKWQKTE
jgi:hypothetical protein